jgi:hypothetical protein
MSQFLIIIHDAARFRNPLHVHEEICPLHSTFYGCLIMFIDIMRLSAHVMLYHALGSWPDDSTCSAVASYCQKE